MNEEDGAKEYGLLDTGLYSSSNEKLYHERGHSPRSVFDFAYLKLDNFLSKTIGFVSLLSLSLYLTGLVYSYTYFSGLGFAWLTYEIPNYLVLTWGIPVFCIAILVLYFISIILYKASEYGLNPGPWWLIASSFPTLICFISYFKANISVYDSILIALFFCNHGAILFNRGLYYLGDFNSPIFSSLALITSCVFLLILPPYVIADTLANHTSINNFTNLQIAKFRNSRKLCRILYANSDYTFCIRAHMRADSLSVIPTSQLVFKNKKANASSVTSK